MPRMKREKSKTKVYHVMVRGINKQDLFLDKQDVLKIRKEIKRTKEKYNYELYAYAIMSNHLHLLIYDENDNLSLIMQSLNVSYSSYFNKKYEKTGYVFDGRYKSCKVEDERYLKEVIRYIHKNPENAGIEKYTNTSYYEYLEESLLINKKFILNIFGNCMEESIRNFIDFHNKYDKIKDNDCKMEFLIKYTDEEASQIIKKILQEEILIRVQKYDRKKKKEAIIKILEIKGIKISQISRLTGINRRTIERMRD